jgi:hypothetical protein
MMDKPFNTRLGWTDNPQKHSPDPGPTEVVPHGRYGVGLLTGHPIGLLIVAGVLLMGLLAIPGARLFFAGALVLGGLLGLFLWLRHRKAPFA